MTARERGFLLLTSHLGDPDRNPLTVSQLRMLTRCVSAAEKTALDRELSILDLRHMGYDEKMAERIVRLLSQEELLEYYLQKGKNLGCVPVCRGNAQYPLLLRKRLGMDSPGCLWVRGDPALLEAPAVALVGSRELHLQNREFARAVGHQAACQGLVLVSGNARGADREAQDACLAHGGSVICIVADELKKHEIRERMLFISEEDYDAAFSAQRAISRNRCIHSLGRVVFVAQSSMEKGGTWNGTVKNLRYGWSPVACFWDGSEAALALEQKGAYLIGQKDLEDMAALAQPQLRFLQD